VKQRTILAASDLSARSEQVGPRAARLARSLEARLILAHVAPPAPPAPAEMHEDAPTEPAEAVGAEADYAPSGAPPVELRPGPLRSLGKRLLARRSRRPAVDPAAALQIAARKLDLASEIRLLTGNPAEELAGLARLEAALLMVLGLHRERRVLDLLRLTTMEQIVLAAPLPVLIAHRDAARPYRRVLALTDFSPASAASLRIAARLVPEAEFHAIHALHLPLGARFGGQDAASDDSLTQAEQMRAAFLATPGLPEFAEPPEIVPGGVHEVLAYRQSELAADLVCIGTHSGRDPGQLGFYARDLMRAPPTDLLVAKPA
jgi:nucleotide-binding universal stress UspA family protein